METNPWITAPTTAPQEWLGSSAPSDPHLASTTSQPEPARDREPLPPPTGPAAPQAGVQSPASALPIRPQSASASLWFVGAHGGAGESTLAALDPRWAPAEHAWPELPGGGPAVCLLVARTNVSGLLAAQNALTQWAGSGCGPSAQCAGLILLADAPGKTPAPINDLIRHVAGGAPRLWRVGWVESWRLGDLDGPAPREVKKLIRQLHSLAPAPAGDH